jgi:hypothetical protein
MGSGKMAATSKRMADGEFMAMLHGSDSEDDAPDAEYFFYKMAAARGPVPRR